MKDEELNLEEIEVSHTLRCDESPLLVIMKR
jgi:hypothetical protein